MSGSIMNVHSEKTSHTKREFKSHPFSKVARSAFCLLACALLALSTSLTPLPAFAEEEAQAKTEETNILKSFNNLAFQFLLFDVARGNFTMDEVGRDGKPVLGGEKWHPVHRCKDQWRGSR